MMAKVRRQFERLRALDHLAPERRKRRAAARITCPSCGKADQLVRTALSGGSDEICSVFTCARQDCDGRSISLVVGIGLEPRIVVEDVTSELRSALITHGLDGAHMLVAGDIGE